MKNTNSNDSESFNSSKRRLLGVLSTLPIFAACGSVKGQAEEVQTNDPLRYKFRGIQGAVLRLDAASEKRGVTISRDTGWTIESPGGLGPKGSTNSVLGGFTIPKSIRATWREGDYKQNRNGGWDGGTIIGDYTVPVAERIPDEVLDYIRKNGGALRLKIRLHDTGVAIGWDIEMRLPIPNLPRDYPGARNYLEYRMAGGDFREDWFDSDTRTLIPGWKKY